MSNYIETNYTVDKEFFKSYINGKWEDSNKLYKEYMSWENRKFFVQEIKDFDRPLLRKIKEIWNHLGIRPKDFRCNFFRVTEMTGPLYFGDGTEVLYQNMTVINTKVAHGVKAPTVERIVFHMGLHDIPFEDIKIND